MSLQRANPLPPGKYWVDVPVDQVVSFDAWSLANAATGALHVDATSQYNDGWGWYLFTVKAPVAWNGPGFPTIASASVKTPQDVHQAPVIETPSLLESIGKIGTTVAWGLFGALALAAVLARKST